MRFWDTSAIMPLLVAEAGSPAARTSYRRDPAQLVWWGTAVECVSALRRLERQGDLAGPGLAEAFRRLDELSRAWQEVEPGERLREIAIRLLRTHPLRAGDALRLSAAIVAAEERPATLAFVTLDERLAEAANREGFATA